MPPPRSTLSPDARPRPRTTSVLSALLAVAAVALSLVLPAARAGAAQAPVGLGTADSFAVLAGQGITNTGATTIVGDVGSFPNPAETGFGTVTLIGTNHAGNAVTQQAKTDLTTAYDQAAAAGPPTAVATELGGTTLTPGVYRSDTLGITGTLTLDTQGDPDAVFVFQSASTLVTAADSAVVVLDGTTACNVFWKVSSSATLGTDSHLIGTVLASAAITATNGATVQGRLLAQTEAVTLDHNTINARACAATTGPTTTATTTAAVPTTAGSTATSSSTSTPDASPGSVSTTTPAGSGTGTPGGVTTTSGAAPPTATTTSLARTGVGDRLPVVGGVMIALGALVLALSTRRRA